MLYPFTKDKSNFFKATLPFVIILHHLANATQGDTNLVQWINCIPSGDIVIYIFFAISGFGLVYSYEHKADYLHGFLMNHFLKLFIPYTITLVLFTIFYAVVGFDARMAVVLIEPSNWIDNVMSYVPASWFIFVLFLFYIFFYISFSITTLSIKQKIFLTTLLVFIYYLLGYVTGWSPWRWNRTPAFVVGMLIAYYEPWIIHKLRIYHVVLFCAVAAVVYFVLDSFIPALACHTIPIFFSLLLFAVMFCIPSFSESVLIKAFSRYSMEMYIVQGIPLYLAIMMSHCCHAAFCLIILFITDILLAFCIKWIQAVMCKCFHK